MAFDIEAARGVGRTDDEILNHLASTSGFNVEAARGVGRTDDEILNHLASTYKPVRRAMGPPSFGPELGPEPESKGRGILAESATALTRSALAVPELAGYVMKAMDYPGGLDVVRKTGEVLTSTFGKLKEAEILKATAPDTRSAAGKAVIGALEMSLPSISAAIPGMVVGAGAGPAGMILGAATSGATLMGLAEKERAKEAAIKAGKTPEEAEVYAWKMGAYEAGGEFLSNLIGGKILGLGGVVKATGKETIREVLKPSVKEAVKRTALAMPAEIGGEMITAAGQAAETGKMGMPTQSPWEAAKETIGPSAVLSMIFGIGVHGLNVKQGNAVIKALTDPNVDPEIRTEASITIGESIREVDPELANYWHEISSDAIKSSRPIPIDDNIYEEFGKYLQQKDDEERSQANDFIQSEAEALRDDIISATENVLHTEAAKDMAGVISSQSVVEAIRRETFGYGEVVKEEAIPPVKQRIVGLEEIGGEIYTGPEAPTNLTDEVWSVIAKGAATPLPKGLVERMMGEQFAKDFEARKNAIAEAPTTHSEKRMAYEDLFKPVLDRAEFLDKMKPTGKEAAGIEKAGKEFVISKGLEAKIPSVAEIAKLPKREAPKRVKATNVLANLIEAGEVYKNKFYKMKAGAKIAAGKLRKSAGVELEVAQVPGLPAGATQWYLKKPPKETGVAEPKAPYGAGKARYEMTPDEYLSQMFPDGVNLDQWKLHKELKARHKELVKSAIEDGLNVPNEVKEAYGFEDIKPVEQVKPVEQIKARYEMTPDEYMAQTFPRGVKAEDKDMAERMKAQHKELIESAIKEGLAVPDNVKEAVGLKPKVEEKEKVEPALKPKDISLKTLTTLKMGSPEAREMLNDLGEQARSNDPVKFRDNMRKLMGEELYTKYSSQMLNIFNRIKRGVKEDISPYHNEIKEALLKYNPSYTPEDLDLAVDALGTTAEVIKGVRTRGVGIMPSLIKKGYININGLSGATSRAIATAAQVFRNPKYEVLRFIYTNEAGDIMGHEGMTAFLPGEVPFPDDLFSTRTKLRIERTMKRMGATKLWAVHNHPSGNPTASDNDLGASTRFSKEFGDKYAGHVIIDSNKYSHITTVDGKSKGENLPIQTDESVMNASIPNLLLGYNITGSDSIANIANILKSPEGFFTAVYRAADGRIRTIQDVSLDKAKDAEGLLSFFRNRLKQFGASDVVVIVEGKNNLNKISANIMTHVRTGNILDFVVVSDGGIDSYRNELKRRNIEPVQPKGYWMGAPTPKSAMGVATYVAPYDAQLSDTGAFSALHDKKTRIEIDDSKAKIIMPGVVDPDKSVHDYFKSSKHLGEIYYHPELYKRYPKLKDFLVVFIPRMKDNQISDKSIAIGDIKMGELKKSLIHETQHWVQDWEGWAIGGSPEQFERMSNKEFKSLIKKYPSLSVAKEAMDKGELSTLLYTRLAGEFEARDAAARVAMTPEQRTKILPYSSEKIPLEDLIVQYEGMLAKEVKEATAEGKEKRDKEWMSRTMDNIKSVFVNMAPLKDLPNQEMFLKERYKTLGKMHDIEATGRHIFKSLNKVSEKTSKQMFEFLTTKDAKVSMIDDIKHREMAEDIKNKIISIGQDLVDRGMLKKEIYEKHKGEYIPTVYLRFLLGEKAFRAFGTGRKLSSMGYLKHKKGLSPEVQKIFGRITDPAYLSAKAITVPLRDIAIFDWLTQISNNSDWVLPSSLVEWEFGGAKHRVTPYWLMKEAEKMKEYSDYLPESEKVDVLKVANKMEATARPLIKNIEESITEDYRKVPESGRYGALRGLVVRREIYDDIVGSADIHAGDVSLAEKILGDGGFVTQYTRFWKWAKVAANLPSQVRNFVSNAIFLHLSGVPFFKVPLRIGEAITEVRTNGKYWQIAKENGVTKATFTATEMARIEEEYLAIRKGSGFGWPQLVEFGAKVVNKTGDWYQFMEAISKTAKIIDEMKKGKSAEDATLEAHKWLFDYSLIPPSVRYLRNAPIGIPFLTFQYKAIPRLAEVAAKHPFRFLPYVAMMMILPMLVASMTDVDDDDVDKLKKALPEWLQEKGHAFILPWKDEQGRWQAVDLGYFFPWVTATELGGELAKGDISKAAQTIGVAGGPVMSMVTAITTNKDAFTRKDITDPLSTPSEQIGQLMMYLYRLNMPTWLTDMGAAGKLSDALSNKMDKYGESKTTLSQALARFAGVNIYGVEPERTRIENIKRKKYEIGQIEQRMRYQLKDKNLPPSDRGEIRNEYRTRIKGMNEELRTYIRESRIHPNLKTRGELTD